MTLLFKAQDLTLLLEGDARLFGLFLPNDLTSVIKSYTVIKQLHNLTYLTDCDQFSERTTQYDQFRVLRNHFYHNSQFNRVLIGNWRAMYVY